MSKKEEKLKQKRRGKVLLYSLAFLLLLVLLILIYLKFFQKDYYTIKPRVKQVEEQETVDGYYDTYKTVGWIQIQGTNIDLPILYNVSGYDYPVEQEGYAKMAKYTPGFHNHFVVSGHNVFNLATIPRIHAEEFKRFEELLAFVYYDFAKENKYIQLTYEGEEYLYKIFMAGFIPLEEVFPYPEEMDFSSEEAESYLKLAKKHSLYDYHVDVDKKDNLIVLSTCTRLLGDNTDWNFYVIGRQVRKNEKIRNYSVSKKEKYKEIEEILLESEEENEEM